MATTMRNAPMEHSVRSTNLADLLERVLDKGIVIAGDIRVKLVEVELLTIQLRLVVCSVDKAKELGLDWWNPRAVPARDDGRRALGTAVDGVEERLARLERQVAQRSK